AMVWRRYRHPAYIRATLRRGASPRSRCMRVSRTGSRRLLAPFLLGLLLVPVAAFAAEAPSRKAPGHAAIASAHNLATEAGFEVLAKGGNAYDAAIAVASTLAVVEPQSSGIGGGFFAILHRASDGSNVM